MLYIPSRAVSLNNTVTHLCFFRDLQVHSLALDMVADGVSLDSVQLVLSLANAVYPHKTSVVDVVIESLSLCLKQLEQPR